MIKNKCISVTAIIISMIGATSSTDQKPAISQQKLDKMSHKNMLMKEAFKNNQVPEDVLKPLANHQVMLHKKITFKCPAVDEIKEYSNHLKTLPSKPPFSFAKDGVIYKFAAHDKRTDNEKIQVATLLEKFHAAYVTPSGVTCGYSRQGGQGIELEVDFQRMGVDLQQDEIQYTHQNDFINTGEKYRYTFNPDVEFTIVPLEK